MAGISKSGKIKNSVNPSLNSFIFFTISLFLSIIIIIISTTVFVTIVYVENTVNFAFFFMFLVAIFFSVSISFIAAWKILKDYPVIAGNLFSGKVIVVDHPRKEYVDKNRMEHKIDTSFFSETELLIIQLLKDNHDAMLQSNIASSINASKASISRAITSLENKGIVAKMRKGVTNEIILIETG